MKFSVGDDIIVRNTKEKGKVVELIDHEMVRVKINNIEFPTFINEIDFPYFDLFTTPKVVKPIKKTIDNILKEKSKAKENFEKGFAILLVPVIVQDYFGDDMIEKFKLHFTNNTGRDLDFEYEFILRADVDFQLNTVIKNETQIYVHDVSFENMSSSPLFHFTFCNTKNEKHEKKIWDLELKLKPKKLQELLHKYRLENLAVISLSLFEEVPLQISKEKDFFILNTPNTNITKIEDFRAKLTASIHIIDLHIEKLVENHEGLQPLEKLQIQLDTFEKALDTALASEWHKLTVIHGIGKGVLLENIKEVAEKCEFVKKISNNYDARYGYGATHIYFK